MQRQVPDLEAEACDEAGTPVWRLGTLRAVLTSLVAAFGEHFEVVTGDAGLAAAENAALVRQLGKHYLLGLKGNQPTLHGHAVEAIADKRCAPRARTEDRAHGQTLVRELSTHALGPGEVEFPGARLLLCVRQTRLEDNGTSSTEWRYFVTSLCTVGHGLPPPAASGAPALGH